MKPNDILRQNPIPYFFRIVYLSNNYRDPLLRMIEHGFGLTRPEFSILICLFQQPGMSAIDVSEITRQPQNTISRGVFLLLKKGMIRKMADPGDGRRSHLHLTKKGQNAYSSFIGLLKDANDQMIACLTAQERAQLDAMLDKMCAAVAAAPVAEPMRRQSL